MVRIEASLSPNLKNKKIPVFRQSLSELGLAGTRVTDAGLVHLKGMSQLAILNLTNTNVTDAGLVHLEGPTHLSSLWLVETRITDAGLVHLEG
jgi:hypothetical protein